MSPVGTGTLESVGFSTQWHTTPFSGKSLVITLSKVLEKLAKHWHICKTFRITEKNTKHLKIEKGREISQYSNMFLTYVKSLSCFQEWSFLPIPVAYQNSREPHNKAVGLLTPSRARQSISISVCCSLHVPASVSLSFLDGSYLHPGSPSLATM